MISKHIKLILIVIILFVASGTAIIAFNKQKPSQKVHYHAGFVVFKENKQVDFTDFKYMVLKPCILDKKEEKESSEDDQIEKAHLHDQTGDVVHIEREGSKWLDLFTNLKYEINYMNTSAYLNGKKIDNFQNLVIQPYDSLVVLIGPSDVIKSKTKAVTIKHIKESERRSENCEL